jgi:flagellar biosynthesis protein FlhF
MSQKAESEFEQWLNKARSTVIEQDAQAQTEEIQPSTAASSVSTQVADVEQSQAKSMLNDSKVVNGNFDRELASLKSEMNSIKELLEHQVSELMWQDMERKSPIKAMMIAKLKEMGLSSHVSEHLTHFLSDDVGQENAWPQMLDLLTQQLDTTSNEIITRGGVYSLVGPTGVGKTTTIAKLAARYAQIHGADTVGLISTDSFRIGALEQLATYAKILGCPLKQAKNTEELSEAIYQLRNKKLVLIDTAGMSQRDLKLTERLNTLLTKSRVRIKNYLVLSATAQMSVLQESVQHFKSIPLSGCVFTKIDESLSLGELISVAIHNRLPIGYLTNGQRVPEDIRVANGEKIVQKANQLFELKQKIRNKNNKVVPKAVGMYD